MMARDQHLRDRAPLPHLRSGIMRVLQQVAREALLGQRLRVTYHARKEADTRVDHGNRCRLTSRQHDVAQRQLFQPAGFDDPLVDPFEAAA
jgi:hypothetical protein